MAGLVLAAAGEGILGIAADGTTSFVNPAAARLLGYTETEAAAELVGRSQHAAIHHHHSDGTPYPVEACPIYEALRTGAPCRVDDEVFWRRDGTPLPVDYTATPAVDGGRIVGAVLSFQDVSARRAAEAERARLLAETEAARRAAEAARAQLQAVFAQAPAAVAVTAGAEHRFVLANARVEVLLGRADLVGRPYAEVLPEAAAQGYTALLDRVYATGEPYVAHEAPVAVRRADGTLYDGWFDFVYQPLRDATGAVTGILQHAVDVSERVRARQALEEREQQLRTMLDAIPTLAWTARADGHIDWYNARWYEYTGTTAEQMVGWGWQSVHDPAVLPAVLERWQASIATGEPFEMAFPLRGANGSFRDFLTRVAPVRDAGGRVTRWFGTNTDLTPEREAAAERERLLAALAAQNAQLQEQRRELERSNRQLQDQAADLEGTTEELQATAVHLEELIEAADRARGEAEAARVAADLERRRLQALLEQLPVGVTLAEAPSGRLVQMNAAVRRLWGAATPSAAVADYSTDYVGYYPATSARAGQRYANEEWPLARALATGEAVTDEVIEVERPGGERVLLSVSAAPVRDADGAVVGGVVTTVDVTERERLLAVAEAARAAADAANEAKSQFLANMSHELRTPLNAIGGYAQLLELGLHGPVTEEQRAALGRIQGAQRRLLALINDILNYAKLEGGKVEYDIRVVDVREVVAEVVPLVEPQLVTKGLTFAVQLPDTPCLVWADREKLGQVFVNLLSNAAKFTDARHPVTRAPGRVTVDLCTRGTGSDGGRPGVVFVRVTDTGVGVPREKQEAIFEPFVQVRAGYAQATEGTGLGLAISRDLARGMGGDLRVRSREGAGSTFTIALRRVAGPAVGAVTDAVGPAVDDAAA